MVPQLLWFLLLLHGAAAAKAPKAPVQWQTLNGESPLVIARGGFSGLFPESSLFAYQGAGSLPGVDFALFCDLQLTKDGVGFCHSDLRLNNYTNIANIIPNGQKKYKVNGEPLRAWFAVDYTMNELVNLSVIQNIFSRPSEFDNGNTLLKVEDVCGLKPPFFWLNVQYDMFYKEHHLDPTAYISLASRNIRFDYISSPEIGFLKGLKGKLRSSRSKLIFRFLDVDALEPTTNNTYGTLLKDLKSIKTFGSGILVPKTYIWPVGTNNYIATPTTLVTDAHKLGLEVYASDFANDIPGSYDYSYDPTAEYLQFIDNGEFSVDGVLTDFPPTATEAIACLAHNKGAVLPKDRALIISHNGASGVYPGCTDLAYQEAVKDGADVIDCSVQMSSDGVAFCLNAADLMGDTTAMSMYMSRSTMIPEIQQNNGIFSFDLTWEEIQGLKPSMYSPFTKNSLLRNPEAKNQGKLLTLLEFLDFAKKSTASGILINIMNAAYLASKKGLSIVDAVSTALVKASYDKQTNQQVLIQSDDTSVLLQFNKGGYKRVLLINNPIGSAPIASVDEIKKFADAVNVPRSSLVTTTNFYVTGFTNVVDSLHAANISVYVSVLMNEFMNLAFDYLSDPIVELSTIVGVLEVDGVVTDFPATARAYMSSPCFDVNSETQFSSAEPGKLLDLLAPEDIPPAQAPAPALNPADVVDPPLPPLEEAVPAARDAGAPLPAPQASPSPPKTSGHPKSSSNAGFCVLMFLLSLSLLCKI